MANDKEKEKDKEEKPIEFTAFGNEPYVITEEDKKQAQEWIDDFVKQGLIVDPKIGNC